jgi:hypothetical protein
MAKRIRRIYELLANHAVHKDASYNIGSINDMQTKLQTKQAAKSRSLKFLVGHGQSNK